VRANQIKGIVREVGLYTLTSAALHPPLR
jgi:hypothetical protein